MMVSDVLLDIEEGADPHVVGTSNILVPSY
jgi:hypothetical protein